MGRATLQLQNDIQSLKVAEPVIVPEPEASSDQDTEVARLRGVGQNLREQIASTQKVHADLRLRQNALEIAAKSLGTVERKAQADVAEIARTLLLAGVKVDMAKIFTVAIDLSLLDASAQAVAAELAVVDPLLDSNLPTGSCKSCTPLKLR